MRRNRDRLADRARGAMLGLAVGDALGAPLEWLHPDQISARYGGPLRDMVASPLWERGEWTDDTAMALALAESMVDQGGYVEQDVFARYALWARSGPKDIGSTVDAALRRARDASDARSLAAAYHELSGGQSAGNGSLMRTVPIALRYLDDPSSLERYSRLDSGLTHHDPLAGDACVWFNMTVAALVSGRRPPSSRSAVARRAEEASALSAAELADEVQGQMGYVLTALRVGFAAAFGHGDLEEAVVYAANLGGDADTNAAVTGALAGARFGASAIPERWLEPLYERARLTGIATRLLRT
ncbi:MAG TPA: ADP-ribosylglycohydrolase family protein [Gaiellales bacterium]|jgi:ADP-ribosyl-[dinitrogen reductase] hydrolase|nr:ADP-ribosylglycohydrolase family protein [Gaiellales bacterium]